nr:ribonuclease H-like domain-containing protein [Tanacetum cinerariifolium]
MSFSKRPGTDVVCYIKPLDSLKGWNDHFFWVDTFACPALFLWHTGKSVSRNGVPKSSEFNAKHDATLTVDPTKVRVGERERDKGEPKLLETTVGRVVPGKHAKCLRLLVKNYCCQVKLMLLLPILNPNEFDLWKMRIKQYFLMIDYSLWEVILNGDSPAPTRVIKGVVQPVAPTTAEQRLARKNELKARVKRFGENKETKKKLITQLEIIGESLSKEDINLKFLRSLPTEWTTHTLLWRDKTDLEEQSLDDLFNSLKIYEVEIDADDLEEMDLKWQMAMLTMRARWSDTTTIRNDTLQGSVGLLQIQEGMAEEEPTNYALMAYTSSSSSSSDNESDESLPPSIIYNRYQSRDGYHVVPPPYTRTFMPLKPDLVFYNAPNDNETVHTAFNVELCPTKPETNFSPTNSPLAPIIKDWVSDSEDDSEATIPQNAPSFVQPNEQVKTHRKECFVCKSLDHLIKDCDFYEKKMAQTPPRNHPKRENHQHYARMTLLNPQRHVVPKAVLTKSMLVSLIAARPVTAVVLKLYVTRPRQAKTVVTKPYSPPRRHIDHSPSPKSSNFPPRFTAAKAPMDKGVIDSGCSRHMTGNMSFLSNFEAIIGGYVTFGENPKGGKIFKKGKIRTEDFDDVYFVKELKFNLFSISQMYDKKNSVLFTDTECLVLSPEFKLPDENQVLFRVPRENNMYNVYLKNIVPSEYLTCLFAKKTLDESNLWNRRLGHINFKTMNNLVRGLPSKVFENDHTCVACKKGKQHKASCKTKPNTDGDAAFKVKEPEFEGRKPEFEVHVSSSSSAQSKKHDDETKREAKGKSPVESSTGYRNLSVEFKDFFDNSINEVNVVGSLVLAVGQISSNNTNTFSVASPSNAAVKLEDITYSDDEEDVGAEADCTNLETSITVSSIPTTRVHKDHHEKLLQFKMQKVWVLVDFPNRKRAIGFEDPDHSNKVYKVVKALYGLHQAPRAWYETLANYLLENGFQREKIDQTLFIKRQKGNILLVQIYVDDIIFGSTNKDLCKAFEKLMKDKFQISSMGELTFFLGLQIKQKKDEIFISQYKYVVEILRKFGLTYRKSTSTPIDTKNPLLKDPNGEDIDVALSGMESLKKMLHVTNILSAG